MEPPLDLPLKLSETLQVVSLGRLPQGESGSRDQYDAPNSLLVLNYADTSHQCLLTSGVREVLSFFPAVWASL